jgi:acetylornithine deacetylase/succinyl-diaminopimelate desuccinylase-like protein
MVKEYINKNQDRFLSELFELLRIPSVSADSKRAGDVRKAAEYLLGKLTDAGVDKAELCETAGHPIVYGEKNYQSFMANSPRVRALRCTATRSA